jgi:hypothetical protein
MLATMETGVHLDLLAAQGRLTRTVAEELICYGLPSPVTPPGLKP